MGAFRVTYERYDDVRDAVQQLERGGLLVRVAAELALDTPVSLEVVLPDGTSVRADVKVLQVLAGHGVAVTATRELTDELRRRATGTDRPGAGPARHERIDAAPARPPAARELTHAEKIQLALHGNRDQRNAILRDGNRALHPFVLKNPAIQLDDILAIAKNAQSSPEMLKQIAERREWFQRPQVAIALARNPKTPQDVAVRALEYVPIDQLRQLAKGGALPHVVTAARKKVIK